MCQSEERICEVEDGNFEIIQSEENKNEWKNNESLRDLWDTIKRNNLQIIRVSEGEGGRQLIKEIMAENFPNLRENLDIQVHKVTKLNEILFKTCYNKL